MNLRLTSLRVKYVRAHRSYSLPIAPKITLITGHNGSGKTSLIEALYVALQGSSFKGSDTDILQYDAPWYRIDVELADKSTRVVKFDPGRFSGKKQFEINGKTQYRLTYANKYPVVLFEPDELRLINGSPARRRQFFDRFISQIDPEYALSLRRYERALKQRNMLLKKESSKNDLFVWDIALSKYGSYIIKRRIEIIERINPLLQQVYQEVSHSSDTVVMKYSAQYKGSIEQKLLAELHQGAERDKAVGYTSSGPHRHDVYFTLNESAAASVASRGEVRTLVLALKFIEVDILRDATDKDPIIILDDVFSELDEVRQKALMERFSEFQTIITSVTAPMAEYPVVELAG